MNILRRVFRRRKFAPDLIDLEDYTAELLQATDVAPGYMKQPRPIPVERWTADEWTAMVRNRRVAQEIYDRLLHEERSI